MINEFDKFSFRHEYKGISFYFDQPELPTNVIDDKITVLAQCSKCGKEQVVSLKNFKYTVNTKGDYLCYNCKTGDRNKFYLDSFPKEFNIKILGQTYKNDPLRLKNLTKIEIECQECHKVHVINAETLFTTYSEFDTYLCRNCRVKRTNLKIYGSIAPVGNKEIQERMQQTNLERYGVRHALQSETFKEKANNTMIQRYGVKWAIQSVEIKQKTKQSNIQKYGVTNPTQLEETKEKMRQTCRERYGVDYYAQTEEFLIKYKETNLEKYGAENCMYIEKYKNKILDTNRERYGADYYAQTEEYRERYRKTCLQKYGVEHYFQTEEFQKDLNKKFLYKDICFDSSWELAFYIYHEDHNIPIIRLPLQIEYFLEEESHIYNPDFEVNGQLIEIKSSVLLNEDYSLKPHIKNLNRCKTEEEKQYLYMLFEAKTKCMKDNNVQIISDKEIKPYLKYIRDTYGKGYLKQFKK